MTYMFNINMHIKTYDIHVDVDKASNMPDFRLHNISSLNVSGRRVRAWQKKLLQTNTTYKANILSFESRRKGVNIKIQDAAEWIMNRGEKVSIFGSLFKAWR
jgi:hypothetical protein